ncbi:MAG: bifunctional 2-C-methyl-D-erythritol 4-phosphate cytidylyltransferase/2-C-methyl-D-erythritol [Pseudomonadota bacterium]
MNEHPIPSKAEVAVVLVAAGRGLRAGRETPKQYVPIGGRPLLSHTLDALAALGAPIQPVIAAGDEDLYGLALASASPQARPLCRPPVHGGQTRQASVLAGLEALSASGGVSHVLIHDGARPRPSARLLASAVEAARLHKAAVPGLHVTDTIKQIDENGIIAATPERGRLRAVQTPQSFAFDLILAAHRNANKEKVQDLTDDAAIAEWAGHKVHVFDGEPSNVKVTNPEDFARMDASLLAALPDIRTGQGYDVHAFGPGDHVWLGGLKIPHERALVGHSDADVLLHALTDAILGALGDGDIGSHFPPSDPQWKGAASDRFLRHAVDLVQRRGGMIAHLDGTLICEAPKIGPHREAMRARIAEICALPIDRIGVKATTSEGLGFTGRREGIAALALATIRLPVGI